MSNDLEEEILTPDQIIDLKDIQEILKKSRRSIAERFYMVDSLRIFKEIDFLGYPDFMTHNMSQFLLNQTTPLEIIKKLEVIIVSVNNFLQEATPEKTIAQFYRDLIHKYKGELDVK
jgi:hypothetical protein